MANEADELKIEAVQEEVSDLEQLLASIGDDLSCIEQSTVLTDVRANLAEALDSAKRLVCELTALSEQTSEE